MNYSQNKALAFVSFGIGAFISMIGSFIISNYSYRMLQERYNQVYTFNEENKKMCSEINDQYTAKIQELTDDYKTCQNLLIQLSTYN